jgi:hypothetical protein
MFAVGWGFFLQKGCCLPSSINKTCCSFWCADFVPMKVPAPIALSNAQMTDKK